jgi:hypothetical protein
LFNDELDLLAARLVELLDSVIDYHIIVESIYTFNGTKKPLYYRENMHRFTGDARNIASIALEHLPYPSSAYHEDAAARLNKIYAWEMCMHGLQAMTPPATPHDLILLTELQEVPDQDSLAMIKHLQSYRSSYRNHGGHERRVVVGDWISKLPNKYIYKRNLGCLIKTSLGGMQDLDVPTVLTLDSCQAIFPSQLSNPQSQQPLQQQSMVKRYSSCLSQARYYPGRPMNMSVALSSKQLLSLMMPSAGWQMHAQQDGGVSMNENDGVTVDRLGCIPKESLDDASSRFLQSMRTLW